MLGFNQAYIKLRHPFEYVGIFVQYIDPLWGITAMTLYISSIKIELSLKALKLNIIAKQPKITLNRNFYEYLEPINMLDRNQQSKILKNLITIVTQ